MERVIGLGGIFFKSTDKKTLAEWYKKHLGLPVDNWGGAAFPWETLSHKNEKAYTIWSPFANDSSYFDPSDKPFMINFVVKDLSALLKTLRAEGVHVLDKTDENEFGKFGWIIDPEGNKIELWEPPKG
jgi:predicted enzyme related to lactoylglutathione lyase